MYACTSVFSEPWFGELSSLFTFFSLHRAWICSLVFDVSISLFLIESRVLYLCLFLLCLGCCTLDRWALFWWVAWLCRWSHMPWVTGTKKSFGILNSFIFLHSSNIYSKANQIRPSGYNQFPLGNRLPTWN